jgi:hypothetical protein
VQLSIAGINFSRFKWWRAIAIAAIVALLVVATQLWSSHMKDEQTTRYLKTVGSCNQPTTIKIYDETGGVQPYMSWEREEVRVWPFMWWKREESRSVKRYFTKPVNKIDNKYFKKYINTISRFVFAKVDKIAQCQRTADLPKVELVFVYRPAILSREIVPFNNFTRRKSKLQDTNQLDSPWVKLTLDRSPKLDLQAVFIWSERQFLLDQALMLGERSWDSSPLIPIDIEIFDRLDGEHSDAATPIQQASVAKKLPTDLRWLFKNARLSHSNDITEGEAISGLKLIMEKYDKPGYTDLNIALINKLFSETKNQLHYNSVLDLKELFDIDKYQIDTVIMPIQKKRLHIINKIK